MLNAVTANEPTGNMMTKVPDNAKWAFTTRRVTQQDAIGLSSQLGHVEAGDLVLARVIRVGHHQRLQMASGRHSTLYPGDHIVVACGDRYAPDQFEGIATLDTRESQLLAGGGVIGKVRKAHQRMGPPTALKPLALLTDQQGKTLNLANYRVADGQTEGGIPVFVVIGNSMNAGKTTAAVSLAHGLQNAGLEVAGIKATGTGAFGDYHAFMDAGIRMVMDFTDAGMATTYRQPMERIEQGLQSLLAQAQGLGANVAVVEIADGIFQQETATLLRSRLFAEHLRGVLFAAPDALSAVAGVRFLENRGIVPFAVSGKVSCSPLAMEEFAVQCEVPVVTREDLCQADIAMNLAGPLMTMEVAA